MLRAGVYEHAIAQTATVISLRVGLATELVLWQVPWVEFNECVQNCDFGRSYSATNSDLIPTLAIALIPSYRLGRMTYFGGLTLRNQPTITEQNLTQIPDNDGGPQAGPFTATVHVGVGVDVGAGIHASVIVHDTLTDRPITYGPSVGLELEIPLGERVAPRAAI